jgi:hypothetical protein
MATDESTIRARSRDYSDVDFGFRANPVTGDVSIKRGTEAIKQSVRNILLTNKGERPFDPEFGSNIRSQLFENFDPITETLLAEEIRTALRTYEPRVRVLDVVVDGAPDRNAMSVTLNYEIQSPEQTADSLTFSVERLR